MTFFPFVAILIFNLYPFLFFLFCFIDSPFYEWNHRCQRRPFPTSQSRIPPPVPRPLIWCFCSPSFCAGGLIIRELFYLNVPGWFSLALILMTQHFSAPLAGDPLLALTLGCSWRCFRHSLWRRRCHWFSSVHTERALLRVIRSIDITASTGSGVH